MLRERSTVPTTSVLAETTQSGPPPGREERVTGSVSDELGTVFAGSTGGLLTREALRSAALLVTSVAVTSIEHACGAGLSVIGADGVPQSLASTDDVVERLDDMQYSLAQGPCLTAWTERSVIRSDDLRLDRRWPQWSAVAVELGVLSVISAPIVAGDEGLGAFKVYAHQPAAFGDRQEQMLALLAAQAAFLLKSDQVADQAGRVSDRVRAALRRRDVVNLAKGIIMSRDTVPADMAFARLVGIAERDGKPVHEVAAKLVDAVARRPGR